MRGSWIGTEMEWVVSRTHAKAIAIVMLLSAFPGASFAKPPQSPIASGPFDSVVEALVVARQCGLQSLRLRVRPDASELFLDGEPSRDGALQCLWTWMTPRGVRLGFAPRWWKDDFTKDHP